MYKHIALFCLLLLMSCTQKETRKHAAAGNKLEAQARSLIDSGNVYGGSHTKFKKKVSYFERAAGSYTCL